MTSLDPFTNHSLAVKNFEAYNRVTRDILENTGVVIWDSTVPLSLIYTLQCVRRPTTTPVSFWWKCVDFGHVGYLVADQCADMLLNYVCNKYMSFGIDYCE